MNELLNKSQDLQSLASDAADSYESLLDPIPGLKDLVKLPKKPIAERNFKPEKPNFKNRKMMRELQAQMQKKLFKKHSLGRVSEERYAEFQNTVLDTYNCIKRTQLFQQGKGNYTERQ